MNSHAIRAKLLAAIALLLFASVANAGGALVFHQSSYHIHSTRIWNEINPGVELRLDVDPGFVLAGAYRNSLDRTSYYVGAGKTLWSVGPVDFNVMAGLVTGYEWTVVPAILPEIVFKMDRFLLLVSVIPPVKWHEEVTPAVVGFSVGVTL